MSLYTFILIESQDRSNPERRVHWTRCTNDDNSDGEPDGRIAVAQGFGPMKEIVALFGKSRVYQGRRISVYVNGELQ